MAPFFLDLISANHVRQTEARSAADGILCGSACGMPVFNGQANSRRRELVNVAFRFGSMPKNEQARSGEPKFGNPKLLPIGNGFGFLFVFGDLG